MHNDARQRMVVLGLDGLPLDLARDLCAAGRTPHLSRIVNAAGTRTIEAELPELSPVNWTSFYTAAGPEEHGVFGFTRINAATYALSLADFTQVRVPTLFDRLGETGFTSRVVNLPNTYPARPIPGMLVSGFVATDLARAVHPPFLLGPLAGAGYRLEADTSRGGDDPAHLLVELRATLESRRKALRLLWPDLAWHLFVFVLTETDRLFHFLWDAVTDVANPLHGPCMDVLALWDTVIGEVLDLVAALPGGARLMVLADHGFTRLVTEVDINTWLRQEGLLQLAPAGPTADAGMELDATRILPGSGAFALDPGRIYLHTRRRFARGGLSDAEGAALAVRLRESLLGLTYAGRPVLRDVLTADALYDGPCRDIAPDLVCVPHEGFDLKAKFNRPAVFGTFGRTGTHSVHGGIFHDSEGGAPHRLRDAGGLVLEHFGLSRRPDAGGRLVTTSTQGASFMPITMHK